MHSRGFDRILAAGGAVPALFDWDAGYHIPNHWKAQLLQKVPPPPPPPFYLSHLLCQILFAIIILACPIFVESLKGWKTRWEYEEPLYITPLSLERLSTALEPQDDSTYWELIIGTIERTGYLEHVAVPIF